jgi:3-hydroxyacyl-[acyl-carrier-protein] dehydratase
MADVVLNVNDIMKLIPHRYPFLMIERLQNIIPHENAIGIKLVSINEPYFQGHFPGHPVMPGVLIVEAFAQTAGALVMHSNGTQSNVAYFMSVEEAKFRKPVFPGDVLEIHVKKIKQRSNVYKYKGQAIVSGELRSEATFTVMVMDQ